jgi:anti-sigma factor RsiW
MNHLDEFKDAYLDNELSVEQRRLADIHLDSCDYCRTSLAQRRMLVALLQNVPAASSSKSEAQFLSVVQACLPNQHPRLFTSRRIINWAWMSIPLILLAALVFINSTMIMSGLMWLIPSIEDQLLWQASVLTNLAAQQPVAQLIDLLGLFTIIDWNWLVHFVALLIIGGLYLAWLALWWVQAQPVTVEN